MGICSSSLNVNDIAAKDAGAAHLSVKGFTVGQILTFYSVYFTKGLIRKGMSTNDVVRKIILPETKDPPRSYMDSAFMLSLGGGGGCGEGGAGGLEGECVSTVKYFNQAFPLCVVEFPSKQLTELNP